MLSVKFSLCFRLNNLISVNVVYISWVWIIGTLWNQYNIAVHFIN